MSDNFDMNTIRQLSKMKNVDEIDAALSQDNSIKNEFQSSKDIEDLKETVKQQQILLHAMWLMLKEHGADNEEFNRQLKAATQLYSRNDFKNSVSCPSCGKGMQKMEKVPFTLKCYYCGEEYLCNPFMKFDDIDPNVVDYKPERATSEQLDEQSKPEQYEQKLAQTEEDEIANAEAILKTNYEPYDVSKDLNFEEDEL